MVHCVRDGLVGFEVDLIVAASGRGKQYVHACGCPHGIHLMYANGIGGADNSGDVMRLEYLLQADRQIWLPGSKYFTNPCIAFRTHKR